MKDYKVQRSNNKIENRHSSLNKVIDKSKAKMSKRCMIPRAINQFPLKPTPWWHISSMGSTSLSSSVAPSLVMPVIHNTWMPNHKKEKCRPTLLAVFQYNKYRILINPNIHYHKEISQICYMHILDKAWNRILFTALRHWNYVEGFQYLENHSVWYCFFFLIKRSLL